MRARRKIIRDMDELDKSRNLGMFDLERSLQLSVLRDGMTQGEYREALLDGFNGLDPKDLVFTGYAPANVKGTDLFKQFKTPDELIK